MCTASNMPSISGATPKKPVFNLGALTYVGKPKNPQTEVQQVAPQQVAPETQSAPEQVAPTDDPVRRVSRRNRMSIRAGGSGLSVPL